MKKLLLKIVGNGFSWLASNLERVLFFAAIAFVATVSYKYGAYRIQQRFDSYVNQQYKNLNEVREQYDQRIKEISNESDQRYSSLMEEQQKNSNLRYRLRRSVGVCSPAKASPVNVPETGKSSGVGKTGGETRSDEELQRSIRSLRAAIESQRAALRQCVTQYQKYSE